MVDITADLEARDQTKRERVYGALERAKERGGLPTLQDRTEYGQSLAEIFNVIEEFASDAQAVDDAMMLSDCEIPFEVTVEHVAAIALIVDETDQYLELIRKERDKLAKTLALVDSARGAVAAALMRWRTEGRRHGR